MLYLDSTSLDFKGGSSVEFDDEYGLGFDFGYHVNEHLELQFSFDWMDVDYAARLQNASHTGTVDQLFAARWNRLRRNWQLPGISAGQPSLRTSRPE